jgi:hypothetical protein
MCVNPGTDVVRRCTSLRKSCLQLAPLQFKLLFPLKYIVGCRAGSAAPHVHF